MHIVHIAPEFAPLAKAGGLGDVLLGLMRALHSAGHRLSLILPHYRSSDWPSARGQQRFSSSFRGKSIDVSATEIHFGELQIFLLSPETPECFFSREEIYGYADDVDRFLCFSQCAVDFLLLRSLAEGSCCDLIHLHDWPTAIIPAILNKIESSQRWNPSKGHSQPSKEKLPEAAASLKLPKTLLMIHNLNYQGLAPATALEQIGLSPLPYLDRRWSTQVNLLRAGILTADEIVTGSPTYAREVLTDDLGCGLSADLLERKRQKTFQGILNGIDFDYWNPESDPHLSVHYSAAHPNNKLVAKRALQEHFQMQKSEELPLFAVISRLVPQKSPELIEAALRTVAAQGGQFVLLGSSPIPEIEAHFLSLKEEFSAHPNVRVVLASHNERLAHQIYGAANFLVVPSLYEPCGLVQMIALRYGALVVARRTGGLADSLQQIESSASSVVDQGTAFLFDELSSAALEKALYGALSLWKEQPLRYQQLVCAAMQLDWSWQEPMRAYARLYERICSSKSMVAATHLSS